CDECQARSVGLVRYPTTLAPASGSVTVATQCADNAHVRTGFSLNVRCSSSGGWSGTTPQCECDTGYRAVTLSGRQICQSVNTCPARSFGLVDYPTTLAPVSGSVTVATQCADNAHVRTGFSLNVRCSSSGSWTGTTPQCECDTGYRAVTVSGRKICQTDETTCPPTTDPPSIGAVNETKVLGCGLISWKPPPGNEGVKLSYVVRFFDGSTYDTSSGYKRIQRNSEIGRQWTRVNDIPDGRTVYADIRARNTSGNVGVFSQKFVVANSTLCADDYDECQARSDGLVRYPTTPAPASGSVTVTTQCADNAHVRTGSSLSVRCSSSGSWTGTTPQCECDTGYEEDDDKCKAKECPPDIYNITDIPRQDLDLKIVYGYVHLSWDTVALETTLVFYEESKNKPAVHTYKTTDDYYHLQINTDKWLVDINDETMIIVQINNQARERRETENDTSTTFEFTKKEIREKLDTFSECVTQKRQSEIPDTESVVDGTSLAIAILLTFALTAAAVVFLSISLGLILRKRSEMKREKSSKTADGDISLNDYDEQKTSSY
ncbi:Ephrin type-A receptor 2, partial [Geodia barretti]